MKESHGLLPTNELESNWEKRKNTTVILIVWFM